MLKDANNANNANTSLRGCC